MQGKLDPEFQESLERTFMAIQDLHRAEQVHPAVKMSPTLTPGLACGARTACGGIPPVYGMYGGMPPTHP